MVQAVVEMAKTNKEMKKFEFSRGEAIFILSIILVLFISAEYIILSEATNLSASRFLISNLFIFGIVGLFIVFISFFYSDVIIEKNDIEVTYLGWYLFRVPRKKFILFNDIVKIHHTGLHPSYATITIVAKNTSATIFYYRLNKPFTFIKILLSKVSKNCEIIGFKRTKEGELK
jgi:hypothetical protein